MQFNCVNLFFPLHNCILYCVCVLIFFILFFLPGFAATMDSNHETDDTGLDSKETQSTKSLRGKVILHGLQKRRCEGIRNSVSFNTLGQPYGPVAAEMQSYIGMLARTEVKITYKTWKQVPKNVKDAIWEHVNVSTHFLSHRVEFFARFNTYLIINFFVP